MAKSLTKMQLAHLSAALKKATEEKLAAFRKTVPIYNKPKISEEERINLIFEGMATLKPRNKIDRYTEFSDAYSLPSDLEREKADAYVAELRKICDAEAQQIYEKAVFLGAEEAFALLKEFQGA